MKNFKQLTAFGLAATLTGISGVASAATVDGNASATVLAPLAVIEKASMAFGGVSGDPLIASSVTLDTAGTVTANPGAWADQSGTAAGGFNVTGGVGAVYTITLPASTTVTNGGNTMTVNNFTKSVVTGTIDGIDNTDFTVGADLLIGAAQAQGAYSGTYVMTVNYQ